MKLSILATAFAVWTSNVAAIGVTGAAEGFAKGALSIARISCQLLTNVSI